MLNKTARSTSADAWKQKKDKLCKWFKIRKLLNLMERLNTDHIYSGGLVQPNFI